jgi:phosphoglycolate phosphatase-like HAD superfamily hydrolase
MNVIVDIDHCVADAAWRDHLWRSGMREEWHQEARNDPPVPEMIALVDSLALDHNIICMTGRPERWRQLTILWLIKHNVPFDELIMREDDCYERTPELKIRLARQRFGDDLADLHLVMDDREDVLAAFSALGVTTLHVRVRGASP